MDQLTCKKTDSVNKCSFSTAEGPDLAIFPELSYTQIGPYLLKSVSNINATANKSVTPAVLARVVNVVWKHRSVLDCQ